MKKLFLLFFILLIAIAIGFLIHEDPGYVTVSYKHLMISTSVCVAAACILLGFIVFYFLMRVITNIAEIPEKFARRKQIAEAKKYREYLMLGISELTNGNQKKADHYFSKLRKWDLISEVEFNQLISLERRTPHTI